MRYLTTLAPTTAHNQPSLPPSGHTGGACGKIAARPNGRRTHRLFTARYPTSTRQNADQQSTYHTDHTETNKDSIIAGPHSGNRIAAKLLLVFLNFCCLCVDDRDTLETRGFLTSRNTGKKSNLICCPCCAKLGNRVSPACLDRPHRGNRSSETRAITLLQFCCRCVDRLLDLHTPRDATFLGYMPVFILHASATQQRATNGLNSGELSPLVARPSSTFILLANIGLNNLLRV
jgi:hypothetical protein